MKKKTLLTSFLLVALTACGSFSASRIINSGSNIGDVSPANEVVSITKPFDENYNGVDFSNNDMAYILDKAFNQTINTFEATIRLSTSASKRCVIFGNYNYYNNVGNNKNAQNFEITDSGRVRVFWKNKDIIFTKYDFRTGVWETLSVVRESDGKTFNLYVNGELNETVTLESSPGDVTYSGYRHRIGNDVREGSIKFPFLGEIASVSCYHSPRTSEQIVSDFENVKSISVANRGIDLMFHTLISPLNDILYDTSNNSNHARAMTNDMYYDVPLYSNFDYSFGVVGDTQILAQWTPEEIKKYSYWAIDNKESKNLQAMLYMGDLANGRTDTEESEWRRQWENVSTATNLMDDKVPYVVVPGNHDYLRDSSTRDLTMFNEYYPYSKFSSKDYYGGAYQEDHTENTYYTFEVQGIKYLVMAMEFGPVEDVLNWMDEVIESHKDYRTIVITHGFLNPAGELYSDGSYLSADWYFSRNNEEATSSAEFWNKHLSKHENLFMILCGHSVTESVALKILDGQSGNKVITLRMDPSYLIAGNGCDPVLGLLGFNETTKDMTLNYFSTSKNQLYNIQNQMRINFQTFEVHTQSYFFPGKEIVR